MVLLPIFDGDVIAMELERDQAERREMEKRRRQMIAADDAMRQKLGNPYVSHAVGRSEAVRDERSHPAGGGALGFVP